MRESGMDLESPVKVFLFDPIQEKNDQNQTDNANEELEIGAIVQVIECGQKSDVHPKHFEDFKTPLPHMDGIDSGKQNGQIVKEIEKGSGRKEPYFFLPVERHAQEKRGRKEEYQRKRVTAGSAGPMRQRQDTEGSFLACEKQHSGKEKMPELRKQPCQCRHERQQIHENEQEHYGL